MNSMTIKTLFQREIWEHKRLIINNFFYGAIALLVLLVVSLHKITQRVSEHSKIQVTIDGELPELNLSLLSAGFLSLASLLALLSSGFYLLNCLYDDRKDRSILFWKSLPISEFHSVLTKFFVGAGLIPILAIVIGGCALVIHGLILSLWLSWQTPLSFGYALSSLHIPGVIAHKLIAALLGSLWLMPIYAWCLFCSALSKKSPVFLAITPPALIIAAEAIIFGSSSLLSLWKIYFPALDSLLYSRTSIAEMLSLHASYATQGPQLLLGLLLSAGLIYASMWLRVNRYEI